MMNGRDHYGTVEVASLKRASLNDSKRDEAEWHFDQDRGAIELAFTPENSIHAATCWFQRRQVSVGGLPYHEPIEVNGQKGPTRC
jgi:hypothetical protein